MTKYSLADGIDFSEESITYIFFFKTGEAGASETLVLPTYLSYYTAILAFLRSLP